MTKISIIFDVDGTLVDISESYTQTVIMTSYIYCDQILGIKDLPALSYWFTKEFYNDLKELIGFNNDYTCTAVMIDFLLVQFNPKNYNTTNIPFLSCSFSGLHVNSLIQLKRRWLDYLENTYKN